MSSNGVNNLNKIILTAIDKLYWKENTLPIGGPRKTVQINETIVVKGENEKSPSTIDDNKYEDEIWIVRGVEKDDPKRFFVIGFPNRKTETMAHALSKHVANGSEILTLGHKFST